LGYVVLVIFFTDQATEHELGIGVLTLISGSEVCPSYNNCMETNYRRKLIFFGVLFTHLVHVWSVVRLSYHDSYS